MNDTYRVTPSSKRKALLYTLIRLLSVPLWPCLAFYLICWQNYPPPIVGLAATMFFIISIYQIATYSYDTVEPDKMVRSIDGKMLRAGQLYCYDLSISGIPDFVLLHSGRFVDVIRLCNGVAAGIAYKVVDEDKFADKMWSLNVSTGDVVTERLRTCLSGIQFTDDQALDNSLLIEAIAKCQAVLNNEWGINLRVTDVQRTLAPVKFATVMS